MEKTYNSCKIRGEYALALKHVAQTIESKRTFGDPKTLPKNRSLFLAETKFRSLINETIIKPVNKCFGKKFENVKDFIHIVE